MTIIDVIILFWLLCSAYAIGAHTVFISLYELKLGFFGTIVNIIVILAMGPLGVLAVQNWCEKLKEIRDERNQ